MIPPNRREAAKCKMHGMVGVARREAIKKHGPLKGGMGRWIHHLIEECDEAVVEMKVLKLPLSVEAREVRKGMLLAELAQVVQLSMEMMVLLLLDKEQGDEETDNYRAGRLVRVGS